MTTRPIISMRFQWRKVITGSVTAGYCDCAQPDVVATKLCDTLLQLPKLRPSRAARSDLGANHAAHDSRVIEPPHGIVERGPVRPGGRETVRSAFRRKPVAISRVRPARVAHDVKPHVDAVLCHDHRHNLVELVAPDLLIERIEIDIRLCAAGQNFVRRLIPTVNGRAVSDSMR